MYEHLLTSPYFFLTSVRLWLFVSFLHPTCFFLLLSRNSRFSLSLSLSLSPPSSFLWQPSNREKGGERKKGGRGQKVFFLCFFFLSCKVSFCGGLPYAWKKLKRVFSIEKGQDWYGYIVLQFNKLGFFGTLRTKHFQSSESGFFFFLFQICFDRLTPAPWCKLWCMQIINYANICTPIFAAAVWS